MNPDVPCDRRVPWSPEPLLSPEDDLSITENSKIHFCSQRDGKTACTDKCADLPCMLDAMSNLSFSSLSENEDDKGLEKNRKTEAEIGGLPEGDKLPFLEAKTIVSCKTSNLAGQPAKERKSETHLRLDEGDAVPSRAAASWSLDKLGERLRVSCQEPVNKMTSDAVIILGGQRQEVVTVASPDNSVRRGEYGGKADAEKKMDVPVYIAKTSKTGEDVNQSALVTDFRSNVKGISCGKETFCSDSGRPVMYFDDDKRLIIATDGPINVAISLHRVRPTPALGPEKPPDPLTKADETDALHCSSNENIADDFLGSSPIISYLTNLEAQDDGIDEGMEIPISGCEQVVHSALYHKSICYRDENLHAIRSTESKQSPSTVPYERLLNECDELSDDGHARKMEKKTMSASGGSESAVILENNDGVVLDEMPQSHAKNLLQFGNLKLPEPERDGLQLCESTGNVSGIGCVEALRSRKKNTVERIMGFFRKFDSQKRKRKKKK